MKHIQLLAIAIAAGIIINACNKSYLDKRPLGQLDEAALANKKGVERLLVGAYSLLDGVGGNKSWWYSAASNWIYGSICGSEAYKGSKVDDQEEINPVEKFSMTANNVCLASKWGTVYDGVQRANDVLRIMAKATDISMDDQKIIAAEARFLRAHYHFEAKKMWDKIPFIDETITYGNGNYHVSNQADAWPHIENDLLFAIANLKTTPYQGAVGRATTFTAIALLAKAYIFQRKFHDAKPLLETLITNSPFRLADRYHKNFNPAERNNEESIFSVQMSVNDGFGPNDLYTNGNFGDVLNFPFVDNPYSCCGFFQPSQFLVNHFKTDAVTGLPDLDNFNLTDVKHDLGIPASDPFDPYTGTLDPRLDWTVGRRGIPYLDWGIHPGAAVWIRDSAYGGPYSPKKNLYYQSQRGQQADQSFWTNGSTTNNVNLIRFADVLLWAAEVEAEIGSPTKARDYVNRVRRRAADTSGWVKKADGTFAANYKVGEYNNSWSDRVFALKAIRYERMLELAMEGHRFFDLVRWGIADVQIRSYLEKEKDRRSHLVGAAFQKGRNEYFPIPQLQIDLSAGADGIPKMIQNPGY